jgi:hypothetical protein
MAVKAIASFNRQLTMDNYQLSINNYQLIGDHVLGYGSRAIAS